DDVFVTGSTRPWRSNNFFSAATPSWFANGPTGTATTCSAAVGTHSCNTITAVAFAESDTTCNTYAFGTAAGQLRITTSGGQIWTDLDPANGVPNRVVTSLAFDRTNPGILYVSLSSFDEATPGQPGHVFKTTNALATSPTWTNVSPPAN